MTTGKHEVRDLHCIVCDEKIGWYYEWAECESETYKIGKCILEMELVRLGDGGERDVSVEGEEG